MAFVGDYLRTLTEVLNRARSPVSIRNTISLTASLTVPVARQDLNKLVTFEQAPEQSQQMLSKESHKSIKESMYSSHSLGDANFVGITISFTLCHVCPLLYKFNHNSH